MCEAFVPLIQKGGRVVNVASVAGHLQGYSQDAEQKLKDGAKSLSAINKLVEEYEVSTLS
jgi:NAD(P)-dependent dehydrogenase (short-subunit alcohol dehydrogenase family)